MKTTEISRELVSEGYTKRIDTKPYWGHHGKVVPWGKPQVFEYPEPKKFELYRVKSFWESEYIKPAEFEFLFLYIDGEKLEDIGNITCFEVLNTGLKLDCCVGAG